MRPISLLTALAATAALLVAGTAHAQQDVCLTESELNGVVSFALPTAMDSVMKTCQPRLSPRGWFATQGPLLLQSYAARKGTAWPAAKSALLKLGNGDPKMRDMVRRLPDSALQPFAEGMVAQIVADAVAPDQCIAVERASRLLSPLPPENTAELISFFVIMAKKPKSATKSFLQICPVKS